MPSTAEILSNVRDQRRKLADSGPDAGRTAGDIERVSLPVSDSNVLRDLLIAEGARVVIEIGLAYGSSALAISEALLDEAADEGKSHVIVDPHQEAFTNAGWNAIVDAGLSGTCSLISQRSQLALPQLVADGFVADAAFVDGSHIFHNVFVDLFFLRELVRPGGLIILDDCHWPAVATAAQYFELNTGWQQEKAATETRLRAYRLPNPRIEPSFEDFRSFALGTPH